MATILTYWTVILAAILVNGIVAQLREDSYMVEILQGKLQGKVLKSRGGREYNAFLNIPYAQAGRFQPPTLAASWQGVYQAVIPGSKCISSDPQLNENQGVEDCLHLNVYSPKVTPLHTVLKTSLNILNLLNPFANHTSPVSTTKLPVIVFLHGGDFSYGGNDDIHEKFWMDQDVVLVNVHYRLGPFGFLSTGDQVIPGNFGLKDQQIALQWIHINIAKFGGDPHNVILFGEEAGSASANLHMLSAKSTGLFHAAILHGGCALNPWALTHSPAKMAFRFGKALGCATHDSGALFSCLLNKTTNEILDGIKIMSFKLGKGFSVQPFGPVVEGESPGGFLTVDPLIAMQDESGVLNKVPLMMGVTENQDVSNHASYIFRNHSLLHELRKNWKSVFPIIFEYGNFHTNFSRRRRKYISKEVHKFYFHNKPIDEKQRESLKRALSDRLLNSGMKQSMLLLAKHEPVFPYILGSAEASPTMQVAPNSRMNGPENIVSDSLNTVTEFEKTTRAHSVLRDIQKLVVSFANRRKPVAAYGTDIQWIPISGNEISGAQTLHYYHVGLETSRVPEPFTASVDFWDKTLLKARKRDKKANKHRHH